MSSGIDIVSGLCVDGFVLFVLLWILRYLVTSQGRHFEMIEALEKRVAELEEESAILIEKLLEKDEQLQFLSKQSQGSPTTVRAPVDKGSSISTNNSESSMHEMAEEQKQNLRQDALQTAETRARRQQLEISDLTQSLEELTQRHAKLQEQCFDVSSENDTYKSSISRLHLELESKDQTIAQLQKKLSDGRNVESDDSSQSQSAGKLQTAESDAEVLNKVVELEQLEAKQKLLRAEMKQECSELREGLEYVDVQTQVTDSLKPNQEEPHLQDELMATKAQLQECMEQLREQAPALARAEEELRESEKSVTELLQKCGNAEDLLANTQVLLEDKLKVLNDLEIRHAEVCSENEGLKSGVDETCRELQEELSVYKTTSDQLATKCTNLENELSNAKELLEEQIKLNTQMEEKTRTLDTSINQTKSAVASKEQELREMESRVEAAESEKAEAENLARARLAGIEQASLRCKEMEDSMEEQLEEKKSLEQRCTDLQKTVTHLELQLDKGVSLRTKLEERLEKSEESISAAETTASEADKRSQVLQNEVMVLTEALESMKAKFAKTTELVSNMKQGKYVFDWEQVPPSELDNPASPAGLEAAPIQYILRAWSKDEKKIAAMNKWCAEIIEGQRIPAERTLLIDDLLPEVREAFLKLLIPLLQRRDDLNVSVFCKPKPSVTSLRVQVTPINGGNPF